jgi:hypothetical protein
MSMDANAESNALDAENGIMFPTQEAGETFIRTLRDHRGFCYWCLCPLEVNPVVQFTPEGPKDTLKSRGSYAEFGGPERDVPPDRTDEHGKVVEPGRDEERICRQCGVLDTDSSESRTKETTRQALRHVVSILQENDVDVNPYVADEAVTEAFQKGYTGQFIRTLGNAVYRSVTE